MTKKFGLKAEKMNLTKIYESFLKTLPKADEKTKGNLKARLRMASLYYYANRKNYLVLGTSNKSNSESAISRNMGIRQRISNPSVIFTRPR